MRLEQQDHQAGEFPIVAQGESGYVLLASCVGGDDTGGGLFSFDGRSLEQIDRLGCTGLWCDEGHLARLLWAPSDADSIGEILVYDQAGVQRYARLDALSDPHDLLWDGENFVAVSSATNSILWLSPSGEVVRRWQAPGEGDCWHLNCLTLKDGQLYVAAFGRFAEHRAWSGDAKEGAGIIFHLESGADAITGLTCPHHPRFIDGFWVICNSATHELLQVDERSRVRRRVQLQSWTRGIAFSDDLMFVGESASRQEEAKGVMAAIAVIDRQTWQLLGRLQLPCREVYDLVLAPSRLVAGVRRGFRTNQVRVAEQDQFAMFDAVGVTPRRIWATGDPLPPDACRVQITAEVPDEFEPDVEVEIDCLVENLGTEFFVSAPPNPVQLSYKWFEAESGTRLPHEGLRTRLPGSLPPGQQVRCRMKVQTPEVEGQFRLGLTLVQEMVAWFDDLDARNALTADVRISKAPRERREEGRSSESVG